MFTCLTNRDVINDIKVYRTAVCIAQALVFSKAVIVTVEAKDRKVRSLPVHTRCSERRSVLDLPSVDHAANVLEELDSAPLKPSTAFLKKD